MSASLVLPGNEMAHQRGFTGDGAGPVAFFVKTIRPRLRHYRDSNLGYGSRVAPMLGGPLDGLIETRRLGSTRPGVAATRSAGHPGAS